MFVMHLTKIYKWPDTGESLTALVRRERDTSNHTDTHFRATRGDFIRGRVKC